MNKLRRKQEDRENDGGSFIKKIVNDSWPWPFVRARPPRAKAKSVSDFRGPADRLSWTPLRFRPERRIVLTTFRSASALGSVRSRSARSVRSRLPPSCDPDNGRSSGPVRPCGPVGARVTRERKNGSPLVRTAGLVCRTDGRRIVQHHNNTEFWAGNPP